MEDEKNYDKTLLRCRRSKITFDLYFVQYIDQLLIKITSILDGTSNQI